MTSQFSFNFQSFKSLVGETYLLEGRKYLCWCIGGQNNFIISLLPCFLVPDDNSLLANSIRNNPEGGECFSIPLSDLTFKLQLVKKDNFIQDAFLVKNTNQAKKITKEEVWTPQTLTFKVRSQRKFREKQWAAGLYKHYLEIEPFSLGLGNHPEISKITFSFGYGQSLENSPNSLMKTWLYNHQILDQSAGKTFTMKVNWLDVDKKNSDELIFHNSDGFDLDSFKEASTKNEPDNNPNPSSSPSNNNKGLLIFTFSLVIVAFLGVIGIIIWRRWIFKNK